MKTSDPKKKAILESMKGGLIVSCQVQKDDPIYSDEMVVKMAEAQLASVPIRRNKSMISKWLCLSFR